MLDYSAAPPQSDWSEMIPNGTLARGLLFIRHYNADMGLVETPSKTDPKPGARQTKYLDCLIKILDGPYSGRQIFTKIGTDGSEKYVDMGRSSIRAILEYGRGASPTNMIAYQLADYGELDNHGDGIQVGIKVKLEPAKGEYGEKNDVSVFLSPVAESGTSRDFARLQAGDTAPKVAAKPAATATAAPAWQQAAPATQAPQTAPAWQPQAQGTPATTAGAPAWQQAQPTTALATATEVPSAPANPTMPHSAPVATQAAQAPASAEGSPTPAQTPAPSAPTMTKSPSNDAPAWLQR